MLDFLTTGVFEENLDRLFDRDSLILPALEVRVVGINNGACLPSNGTNKYDMRLNLNYFYVSGQTNLILHVYE